MATHFNRDAKIGILGGGQLGRMLIQSGISFDISFSVLDPSPIAPCRTLADFTVGDFTDYETVIRFGEKCDILTVELENVNTKALATLEGRGKKIFPQPQIIALIQDKRLQKQFFVDNGIPTSEFVCVANSKEAMAHGSFLPAVNKLAREGYDGRGVQIIRCEEELKNTFDAPGLLEQWVDIDKEIAVLVARNESGDSIAYPPVEMTFYPEKNILDHLFAPAQISKSIKEEALEIAHGIIKKLQMIGILTVEMFITREGKIYVNEIAPRPHNSGHHTIEACETSQYEQHLRAILNQPLGSVKSYSSSAMVNLLGSIGHEGTAVYRGMQEVLSLSGTHVHLYGKCQTTPFRKMGHVTIIDQDMEKLKEKVKFVKEKFNVTT